MFVVIVTCLSENKHGSSVSIHAVYGPFDSDELAQSWRNLNPSIVPVDDTGDRESFIYAVSIEEMKLSLRPE